MQYICLIYAAENSGPQPGNAEFGEYIQAYQKFTETTQKEGVFVSGDALQPIATSTTVTLENGSREITDGPFAETKEQLGGYYLLDCTDLDQALHYAAMIPSARHGRVEVRPIVVWDN